MAALADAIHARLAAHAGTAALVAARIYPNTAPQGVTFPYLVFEQSGTERIHVLSGVSGLARASVSVTSWALTYDGARALAEQVRQALAGYSGTIASVEIDAVVFDGDSDEYQTPLSGEETGLSYVEHEYGVWFVESVPA